MKKEEQNTEKRENVFKMALGVPQGRNSFIIMCVATVATFIFTSKLIEDVTMRTRWSMICGLVSVIACQQFVRILSAAIAARNMNEEQEREDL